MNEFDIIKRDTVISEALIVSADAGMDVTKEELLSANRKKEVVVVRRICLAYMNYELRLGQKILGKMFLRKPSAISLSCKEHNTLYSSSYFHDFMLMNYKTFYDRLVLSLKDNEILQAKIITKKLEIDIKGAGMYKYNIERAYKRMKLSQEAYIQSLNQYQDFLRSSKADCSRLISESVEIFEYKKGN